MRSLIAVFVAILPSASGAFAGACAVAYDRQDYAEALSSCRPLAWQGDALAQTILGAMYEHGEGIAQDFAEAVRWYRKAAERDEVYAEKRLGLMYEHGRGGLVQNYAEAVKWYRKAAEQGNAIAQSTLGGKYEHGEGVAQDFAEAVRWYRKAAEQGNAVAQNALGIMYERGRGVAQDYAEAAKWYRKAAEQGEAFAQTNLGFMYERGWGVAQDYALAYMWHNLAAAQSDNYAAKTRDELAAKMTPGQIAEAQRLARDWKPTTPTAQQSPSAPLADPRPPPHAVADAVTLYPDHEGSALYAYIDIGPWTERVLLDTGATNLTVTQPLAERLLAKGFAHEGPWVTTTLADGSEREGRTVIIDSVTIGRHVLRDVRAGVTRDGADMLLGLPLLSRIGRFTIDSLNHKLIFS
jgi:clan AA aspartic protease (TIGR02281 family)